MRRSQIGDVGKKGTIWKQNHGSTTHKRHKESDLVKEEGKVKSVIY